MSGSLGSVGLRFWAVNMLHVVLAQPPKEDESLFCLCLLYAPGVVQLTAAAAFFASILSSVVDSSDGNYPFMYHMSTYRSFFFFFSSLSPCVRVFVVVVVLHFFFKLIKGPNW